MEFTSIVVDGEMYKISPLLSFDLQTSLNKRGRTLKSQVPYDMKLSQDNKGSSVEQKNTDELCFVMLRCIVRLSERF